MNPGDPLPVFDDRYEDVLVVAQRPRALVLAATCRETGERRFVKWATPEACERPAWLRVFLHEPAMLRHLERAAGLGVVLPVVDQGELEGRPFFVQPWVPGWNLAAAMKDRPAFVGSAALAVVERVLRLLHAIHGAGVLHADISPENLHLATDAPVSADGRLPARWVLHLTDFETARRLDGAENQTGEVVGKIPYMGPECVQGMPLTPATDLYALGVVFHELLTGQRPHHPRSMGDVAGQTIDRIPTLPLELGVPSLVEAFLRRLLHHEPRARPANAAEALAELRRLQEVHAWLEQQNPPLVHRPANVTQATNRSTIVTTTIGAGNPFHVPPVRPDVDADIDVDEDASVVFGVIREERDGVIWEDDDIELDVFDQVVEDEASVVAAGTDEASLVRRTTDTVLESVVAAPVEPASVGPRDEVLTGVPPGSPAVVEPRYDDNVQFTVYRPRAVRPDVWYPLLAFAHLSERPPDAPADEPDPVAEVGRQAQALLGPQAKQYQNVVQDTSQAIPREGTLTFVPVIPGFAVNPPQRAFQWTESVHREEFRIRAERRCDGTTATGRLSVYWGAVLVADVPLRIRVDHAAEMARSEEQAPAAVEQARPYRKIFASYSHRDLAIVRQVEQFTNLLGDQYLRDWTHLRAGEAWSERLKQLIAEADVFQLFWSRHSMVSAFVRQEWEYALSLGRPHFIRPSYWEEPMPTSVDPPLPPPNLGALHFQRLGVDPITPEPPPPASSVGPTAPPVTPPRGDGLHRDLAAGSILAYREEPPASPVACPIESTRIPIDTEPPPSPSVDPLGGGDANAGPRIGSYRVTQRLGQGGMGSVERGEHVVLRRPVLLKRLDDTPFHRALFAELPLLASLDHPQIVRVLDAFERDGQLYLAREWRDGQMLDARLRDRGGETMPVADAVALLLEMSRPLAHAHERGFVHRDLKPGNVLVGDAVCLMADHLVARGGPFQRHFEEGQLFGTPLYMAPERIAGESRHERASDVYALGVILYELLTGRRPFEEPGSPRSLAALMQAILHEPPPSPRLHRAEIPVEIEAIVLGCLAKSPAGRIASVPALAARLQAWRDAPGSSPAEA